MTHQKAKAIPDGVDVLGVKFQCYINPGDGSVIFSTLGVANALQIPRTSLRRILKSEDFKSLYKGGFACAKLPTESSPKPISVITQPDLAILVRFLAERNYPIPRSMQDAGFPIVLQQSVDEALNIHRERREYLEAGATIRQKLEYKYSYHQMVESTFDGGYGVRSLCQINRQISGLAVPDADTRRAKSKNWRRKCSGSEMTKITIGNTVHQKAVEASPSREVLTKNIEIASQRTQNIYRIMDAPF